MTKQIMTHGGNIYEASKRFGFNKDEFLDYSSNINPFGLPTKIKELLISNMELLESYPDPDCTELKEEISKYLHIDLNRIIIGNGAAEIIHLIIDVLRPRKLLIPAPTFSEYGRAAENFNVEIEYFEMKEETDYKLDMDVLCDSIDNETDAIILCNPNNPTSSLIDKRDLLKLLNVCNKRNVSVIVDETFIELTRNGNKNSVIDLIDNYNNLFIIRAFTKLFALPGLRLGYGLGNSTIIKRMWDKKIPWSVNSLACNIGSILKQGEEYFDKTSNWLSGELEWFYDELKNFKDFKVFKPDTNFVLLKILNNKWDSSKLRQRMAIKGVLIREAENFKFLDKRFLRLAIKDRTRNIKFLSVFSEVVKDLNSCF